MRRRLDRRIGRILQHHLATLLALVPGIRDGDADAIHDARVATRRIRTTLRIAYSPANERADALRKKVRQLGRALGRARDLDVARYRLTEMERTLEGSSRTVATLDRSLRNEALVARRQLIQTLESSRVGNSMNVDSLGALARGEPRRRESASARLRARTRRQCQRVTAAVHHATGVYFPNRLHAVRVETKKLRYLIELAAHARLWEATRELKAFRRVQDILGEIHDRELLLDRLRSVIDDDPAEAAMLRDVAEGERDGLFHLYLAQRADLARAVEAAQKFAASRWRWRAAMWVVAVVGAAAVSIALARAVRERERESKRLRMHTERRHDPTKATHAGGRAS